MPRFMCYCPDHPDYLEERLKVRPEHLARAKQDTNMRRLLPQLRLESVTKATVYSGPILPRPGTKARDAVLPEGTLNIAGSFMVYEYPTLEDCWARLKEDVYWTADIWDKDRIIVEELIG